MSHFYNSLSPSRKEWVDQTLSSLTLDEMIGQKLGPLINIPWDPSRTKEQLTERALKYQVGTVHACGNLSPAEMRKDLEELQAGFKVPALVSTDIETFARYPGAVPGGTAMNLGAISDLARAEDLAFECGRLAARQGRSMGITWAFGPVMDIWYNLDNPICTTRSFSSDPERVAVLGAALVKGFQTGGMAATLKHFPGDGTDTHDQHAVTSHNFLSLDEWRSTYGKTFGRGINAHAYSVMIGHIAMPALSSRAADTGDLLPASLDPRIMQDLLREEMAFEGVIVSDAIAMGGVTNHCSSIGDAGVKHIIAGGDVVLFAEDLDEVVTGVKQALQEGRYSEAQLKDSVRRILTLKASLGLHVPKAPNLSLEAAAAERPAIESLAKEIARSSITLIRDTSGVLPLKLAPGKKITLCMTPDEPTRSSGIQLLDEVDTTIPRPSLAGFLEARGYTVTLVSHQTELLQEMKSSDAIIMVTTCRPIAGRNSIRLSMDAARCFGHHLTHCGKPVIYLNMGNPATLLEVSGMRTCISTYGAGEIIEEAVVQAIVGDAKFPGKLPISMLPEAIPYSVKMRPLPRA